MCVGRAGARHAGRPGGPADAGLQIIRREISKRPRRRLSPARCSRRVPRFLGFAPSPHHEDRAEAVRRRGFRRRRGGPHHLHAYRFGGHLAGGPAGGAEFIHRTFGPEYIPDTPNFYKSKASAQEAHEAIRPTDVNRTPDSLASRLQPDELKLYRLIWERFVACQMAGAKIAQRTAEFETLPAGGRTTPYLFRATASDILFPGYMKVTGFDGREEGKRTAAEDGRGRGPAA
jgi:hypothetical protein